MTQHIPPRQVWKKKDIQDVGLDPKKFPVLPKVVGVIGDKRTKSVETPDSTSVLITPKNTPLPVNEGSIYTLARIVTRMTRHESKLPGGKEGDFVLNLNAEMIHSAEMVELFRLLETRVKLGSLNIVASNVCNGWSYVTNHAHHNGGRIWVLWKSQKIHIDILDMDAQYIHTKMKDLVEDIQFYATFVYEFNKPEERVPLRDALSHWNIVAPWVVLEDFNNILYCNELVGKVVKDSDMIPQFDHCPCTIESGVTSTGRKKPFKFFNMWTNVDDFQEVVRNRWKFTIYGSWMYRVVKKLKLLKPNLNELNKNLFSDVERNSDIAYQVLLECQRSLQLDSMNTLLMDVEHQARESYLMLRQAKEDFLRQKAECNWSKDGDINSGIFHKLMKQRQIQNKVLIIEDMEGRVCKKPDEIVKAFIGFYENLLDKNAPISGFYPPILDKGVKISVTQWDSLCKMPSDAEIQQLIFSIPDDKSP
ncbi:uncharacterized protein LOC141607196 [Silene latifolia]|uniref:uncharacterized protein LOC141607196 n=1 Tax=Silene latifolia TaxID=37657 RepID=UPI003D788A60